MPAFDLVSVMCSYGSIHALLLKVLMFISLHLSKLTVWSCGFLF